MVWRDWVEPAQVVSGTAAAVGLVLTAIGLFVTAYQTRRSRLTADLQVLQKFFEIADKHEYALAHAESEAWTFALNEFLNFLEVSLRGVQRKAVWAGQQGYGPAQARRLLHRIDTTSYDICASTKRERPHDNV